jgi:hypothetical protein
MYVDICTSHVSRIPSVQTRVAGTVFLLRCCSAPPVPVQYKDGCCDANAYQRRTTLLDTLVARLTFISVRAFSYNPRRRSNFALDAFYCPPTSQKW